jgi:uncharacterized UBP type Zn finger protein
MKENLWLNLSDGHIGSGRRQWDGSGGADGALNHYRETMQHFPPSGFPLVVKLGTITPHGADVYSYAEDEDTEVGEGGEKWGRKGGLSTITPHGADVYSYAEDEDTEVGERRG